MTSCLGSRGVWFPWVTPTQGCHPLRDTSLPYPLVVLLWHPLLQSCLFLTLSVNTILTHPHDTMLTALLIISGIPGHHNKLHVFSLVTVDCRSSA
jgi:hypothetical protein